MSVLGRAVKVFLPRGTHYRTMRTGLAKGFKLRINFVSDLRQYCGLYERELVPHFRRLVKRGFRCFDIGGASGYYAIALARLTRGGAIVSFECDPEEAAGMREIFAVNELPIRVVERFVGDNDGGPNITIASAARQFFVPDFIKMDIEGAEAAALRGGWDVLSERMPHMIIEVHGKDIENECIASLRSLGYSPRIVDQRKFFREYRPLGHNRWLICEGRDR